MALVLGQKENAIGTVYKKWGYINTSGKVVIEPQYDWATGFHDGIALVRGPGGHILAVKKPDITAKKAVKSLASGLLSGKTPSLPSNNPEGIFRINGYGKEMKEYFSDGLLSLGNSYVDKDGESKISSSAIKETRTFSEGLGAINVNGKWGFVDTSGDLVIESSFEDALPFSEGIAPVMSGGKWGYIDKSGKIVIKPQYDIAECFFGDLARVNGNDYINSSGTFIWSEDNIFFEKATEQNTIASLTEYLLTFANGRHVSEAKQIIEKINKDEDIALYDVVKKEDNLISYKKYLLRFPNGLYAKELKLKISEIEAQQQADMDNTAYKSACGINTINAYEDYIKKFPKGLYAMGVRAKIVTISEQQQREEDNAAFARAQQIDTYNAYENYIRAFPQGDYVVQAKAKSKEKRAEIVK